jgi:hypothetical protein
MIRRPDKPIDERGGMDWLGPEFLTWLWWRAGITPEFADITAAGPAGGKAAGRGDGTALYVHVDEFLELKGERAAARRTSLRAGMPGASAEGKVALRHGKVVTAARLLFARGEEETALTLKAEDLDLSAVKLPSIDSADAEERLASSLSAARRVYEDLDLLYRTFLDVRTGDRWEAEARAMRAWVGAPSEEERSIGAPRAS